MVAVINSQLLDFELEQAQVVDCGDQPELLQRGGHGGQGGFRYRCLDAGEHGNAVLLRHKILAHPARVGFEQRQEYQQADQVDAAMECHHAVQRVFQAQPADDGRQQRQ